jgi:hypothetical protein
MYCNKNYSGAVKGFLFGGLLAFSLMLFGSNWLTDQHHSVQNTVTFEEAVARLKSDNIREIRIKNGSAEFFKDERVSFTANVSENQLGGLFNQIDTNVSKVTFQAGESADGRLFGYLIQILFWLFFISPPVIVVLLLVIIKKLDAGNPVK